MLTAFVKRLTGFNLVDAIELEDGEADISDDMLKRIQSYQPITSLDRLFNTPDSKFNISLMMLGLTAYLIDGELIGCLVDVLMRWTLGSQATDIPIEGYFHEVIALGVGFIAKTTSAQKFDPNKTAVYLSERLVVLYLRTLFETYRSTTRKAWIKRSIRNAHNNATLGFIFEELALLVLMDYFGGKVGALGDAFHCSPLLGPRKVTLVSLKREPDGVLYSYPVSWDTGISDRFGFKAKSPADVLKFLDNPDGQTFVFPDTHMGPDLTFFLEDKETGELILSAKQSKVTPDLKPGEWRSAVISVTPRFFYTMVVSLEPSHPSHALSPYSDVSRRKGNGHNMHGKVIQSSKRICRRLWSCSSDQQYIVRRSLMNITRNCVVTTRRTRRTFETARLPDFLALLRHLMISSINVWLENEVRIALSLLFCNGGSSKIILVRWLGCSRRELALECIRLIV